MSRQNAQHRSNLVAHLSTDNLSVMQRVKAMQQSFIAKGMNTQDALKAAYKSMEGSVMRQAAVLSYMDVFLMLGLMFLIFVPIVLIVVRNKKAAPVDLSNVH